MPPEACPICAVSLRTEPISERGDSTFFDCPNCGRFEMTEDALLSAGELWEGRRRKSAVLSHEIRQRQRQRGHPKLGSLETSEILTRDYLPSSAEQLDRLLAFLGEQEAAPGEGTEIVIQTIRAEVGALSVEGVGWLLNGLASMGFLELDSVVRPRRAIRLTPSGWARLSEISARRSTSRRAFMAMKFEDEELNELFASTLRPAIALAGFELFKLDDNPVAGLIDMRLRTELRRSRFLLADLSHENPGAYWEAGFMEGLGRPVIYLCKKTLFKAKGTHFDTNHSTHILWDPTDASRCGRELTAVVRATLPAEARLDD